VGAGNPVTPVTIAWKIRSWPVVGVPAGGLIKIVGIADPKLTAIVDDVAVA